VASDYLIAPLGAEDFAAQGLAAIQDCVEAVQAGPNRGLRLLGYLITMFNSRLAIHKAYEAMLRQMYGDLVLSAMVPLGTDFKEAIAQRKPIAAYKPRGASAKAVKAVADELLARAAGGGVDAERRVA
jgi:chromosome partitioning protein